MARTAISVQTPGFAGATPTYGSVDNSNGNYVVLTGGNLLLHVKNSNASTRTLTLTTTNTIDGVVLTSPPYTIAALTGDTMIVLTSDKLSRLATSGQLYLDWSAATNVSIAVVAVS